VHKQTETRGKMRIRKLLVMVEHVARMGVFLNAYEVCFGKVKGDNHPDDKGSMHL
jgi:hypothetical protein